MTKEKKIEELTFQNAELAKIIDQMANDIQMLRTLP